MMQIVCPDCQFAREVDETKVPARSQVATCPKCKTKFRFRELPEEEITQPEMPASAPAAEPAVEQKTEPAPTTAPVEQERTFPKITAPGEDPKEELWDKLGDMTPPADRVEEQPTASVEHEQPTANDQHISAEEDQQPIPGWTGDFNGDFPDPMAEELMDDEEDDSSMLIPPPFEQLARYGFFRGLYLTIRLVLTSPRLFFTVMPVGGGLAKPLTFAILVAMIQALFQLIWGSVGLTPGLDIVNQEVATVPFDVTNGVFELLLTPAVVAVTLFAITGFYHLILILLKADSKGFEGTFRAVAYAYSPMITGLFPMFSPEIMIAWMTIYAFWGLFLTALGIKYIHGTTYAKAIPVVLLPLLLGMIMTLTLFQAQLPTI